MTLLLLLFSLCAGFIVTAGGDPWLSGGMFFLIVPVFFLARHLAKWPYVLAGLAIGLLLGLLPSGPYEGNADGVGIVLSSKSNYVIVWSNFRRYYLSIKNHDYQVLDIVSFKGKGVETWFTNYESRFDFKLYLARLGCKTEIKQSFHELRLGFPIRFHAWENRFLSKLNEESRGFYGNLLFQRSDLQSAITEEGSALGLFHLLSSSGILFSLLLRLFKRLVHPFYLKFPPEWAGALFCLFFLPLGFQKIGIMRVILMNECQLILYLKKKKVDALSLSAAMGIGMFVINPYLSLQQGYLLSFGVSSFLQLSSDFINRFKFVYKKLITLILIHVFLFPALAMTGEIHLFALPFSLLLTPLAFLAYVSGYLGFLTVPIPSFLEGLSSLTKGVLSAFSWADLSFPFPIDNAVFICIYYLLLYFAMYLLELGDYSLGIRFPLVLVACHLLTFVPVQYGFTSQVSFINVGQGDAILLRDHSTVVLIDTGGVSGFDIGEEVLIPYLRKQRIYHIDAIIASHHDHDHIGGVPTLQQRFSVHRYLDEATMFPVQVGPFYFENLNTYSWEEENDKSLVFRLRFLNKWWMFTGDAPSKVEQAILKDHDDLDVDILKVGHHGSSTSTCAAWLDALTPETAIISCGRNNKYHHPEEEVLARLNERNIKIRRTDLEGTITYTQFL